MTVEKRVSHYRTRVSQKGWIVIPARLRKLYRIEPGSEVQIVEAKDGLRIIPRMANPVKETAGKYAGKDSLIEDLLRERKKDAGRE